MSKPRSFISGSGGGSRGALFPHILEQLEEHTNIVGKTGTSVSALHAYGVCTENTRHLRGVWQDIKRQRDFMRGDWPADGRYSLGPTRKLMEKKRWGLPTRRMFVGVFYWAEGQHRVVRCNHRPLEDVLDLAIGSSSIAGIHNVTEFGDHHIGDGGHHSPLPPMPRGWKEWGLDQVHILSSHPLTRRIQKVEEKEVNGPIEQIGRYAEYQGHRALLQSVQYYKRLARENPMVAFYLYAPRSWRHAGPSFTKDGELLRRLIDDRLEHGEWMYRHRNRL